MTFYALGSADKDFPAVFLSSQPCMRLRKPHDKSLVRLILQANPKMEIGYSEVELLGECKQRRHTSP